MRVLCGIIKLVLRYSTPFSERKERGALAPLFLWYNESTAEGLGE
jgi:hypothetical protein